MIPSSFRSILATIKIIIWPIKKEEIKLFLPLALMMFCILFNFGALRSVKDALVVPSIGAEVISFLKLWLVLPSSIIFTLFYVKLSNLVNFEHVFYIVMTVFLSFFLMFAYVIYPNQLLYHPDPQYIIELSAAYPNFQWFVKIAGKWSYAIMYVFSELWSAVVINLMFWQFANHIFDTEKAKRFYPILGMIGNMGLILAGNILVAFSNLPLVIDTTESVPLISSHQLVEMMLKPIMSGVVLSGILAMVLFKIINSFVLNSSELQKNFQRVTKETKTKLSMFESINLVVRSKYLGHIVLLTLCYGLLINILEGPWKAKVRVLYPSTLDYVNFMGKFNIWMGISCVIFMIIGSNILRKFSWLMSALSTPVMICITGFVFFGFVIFAEDMNFLANDFNPIYAAVLVGALQNILSKATKYSLFDSTKEMAYIPLSLELRTKGKAAVEVIGTKFGKSLGAFIQSTIFILLPTTTFDSIAAYLTYIFLIVIAIWFWNVTALNREYLKLIHQPEREVNE